MLSKRITSATIERILKRFTRDDEPELIKFVSGYGSDTVPPISDGATYSTNPEDSRPEIVRKELQGWE